MEGTPALIMADQMLVFQSPAGGYEPLDAYPDNFTLIIVDM